MEASTPRREITPGRVISEAFSIYGAHAATLIGMALLIFVISGIVSALLQDAGGFLAQMLAAIVSLVAGALFTGFVVKLVEDVRDGKRDFTVGELFSAASPAIGALIVNSVLWGIAVGIGLLLLIVPGLILLTIWAVCQPAIVSERRGALEAFGRSRELVRGNGMNVFLTMLLAFLIVFAVGIVAGIIGAAIGVGGVVALTIIASTLTAPVFSLVIAVMFFDLGGGSQVARTDTAPVAQV